jgi:hypothetical protein
MAADLNGTPGLESQQEDQEVFGLSASLKLNG